MPRPKKESTPQDSATVPPRIEDMSNLQPIQDQEDHTDKLEVVPDDRISQLLKGMEEQQKRMDEMERRLIEREKILEEQVKSNVNALKPMSGDVLVNMQAQHQNKKDRTKDALDAQPKVRVIIPLAPKEVRGAYETVTINGYVMHIKKGEYVTVPQQVADIIMDSQKQTAEAGLAHRVDRTNESMNALQ